MMFFLIPPPFSPSGGGHGGGHPLRLCGELLRKITINQRPLCAEDLSQSKSENYASDADL